MSDNQNLFRKKAYEIAYAVFRVAPKFLDGSVAQKMTAEAAELLASTVGGDYLQATKSLEILDYFIRFGIDINFISFMNGDILLREINNFNASIGESINAANQDVDISGIFSPDVQSAPIGSMVQAHHAEASTEESHRGSFVIAEQEEKKDSFAVKKENPSSANNNFIKSGMRQIAILDRIRQSGNCRLRDIQEVLPDCSERTIRYDLEDLIERNIVERMGNGGPSVSYRIRQIV